MALLEIHSVKKMFASNGNAFYALNGVDLHIDAGDFIAVTGESGSGKSTLISIIGGIAPPSEGSVIVDSIPIYSLPIEKLADFRREYIGFVFQQFHLMPYLTAIENVMLPFAIKKMKDMEQRELASEALEKVGLGQKAGNLPSQMSGGEQQRVAIARAIVNKPPILLADEPTGNLDTRTGNEIFTLFKELNSAGQTVIVVTHNNEIALRTNRVIRMKDGMIESGETLYTGGSQVS